MTQTIRNVSARAVKVTKAAAAAALLITVVGATWASAAQTYQIIDLGTLGGTQSEALSISDSGYVTGRSFAAGSPTGRAFLWTPGGVNGVVSNPQMQDLHPLMPSADGSVGLGVNSSGQVTGWYGVPSVGPRGFLFSGGTVTQLGTFGGTESEGHGINDSGQITGMARTSSGEVHAFRWTPGGTGGPTTNPQMTDLGGLAGGSGGIGFAINNSGQVTGAAVAAGATAGSAFLYSGSGPMQTVIAGFTGPPEPFFGSNHSFTGLAVNASGAIAGHYYRSTGGGSANDFVHAIVHSGGTLTDLSTLAGTKNNWAFGINDSGHVVGQISSDSSSPGGPFANAFLYSDGVMQNLQNLVPSGSGWDLTRANDINNLGQIVGMGNIGGQAHGFLLTPIIIPKTYGVFVGSDDQFLVGSSLPEIAGKTDAQKVRTAFAAITSLTSSYLGYDGPSLTATPKADIFATLESYTNQVKPNDNFIFFYSGHGSGDLARTDLSLDEGMAITSEPPIGHISDDEFTAWFSDPVRKAKWDGVNKLILLDSCFAGGFWQSEDADLSSIPKTALLAGSGELAYAGAKTSLLNYGEGFFSLALQDALKLQNGFPAADVGRDGLSFDDLRTYLLVYPDFSDGYTGFIKEFPQDPEFMAWNIQGFQSSDFEFSLAVPEPSLLASVAVLLLAMGQLRMRARRKIQINPTR